MGSFSHATWVLNNALLAFLDLFACRQHEIPVYVLVAEVDLLDEDAFKLCHFLHEEASFASWMQFLVIERILIASAWVIIHTIFFVHHPHRVTVQLERHIDLTFVPFKLSLHIVIFLELPLQISLQLLLRVLSSAHYLAEGQVGGVLLLVYGDEEDEGRVLVVEESSVDNLLILGHLERGHHFELLARYCICVSWRVLGRLFQPHLACHWRLPVLEIEVFVVNHLDCDLICSAFLHLWVAC